MATEAEGLIAGLHARGWNNAQIGRMVGRDTSLIRQAALGKKPVANLLPGLRLLDVSGQGPAAAAKAGTIETTRRATKGGGVAGVRQRAERVGAGPSPAIHLTTKGGSADIKRVLERAAKENKRVALTPTFKNVRRSHSSGGGKGKRGRGRPSRGKGRVEQRAEVPMFQKGGYGAQNLLDRINNPGPSDSWKAGDAIGAIKGMARSMGIIEHAGALEQVELHAYNPV